MRQLDHDRWYFLDRAEQELMAAENARDLRAARAHSLLAGFYFDFAFNGHPHDDGGDTEILRALRVGEPAD